MPYHRQMPCLLAKLDRPILAIAAVGLLAGVLRFSHLGYPEQRIFDEYYYSKSACILLGYSNDRCDISSGDERFWRRDKNDTGAWVHPPLGKWMIAAGELAVGTDSYGWRVSAAVIGTATIVLLAVAIQLLFGSALWTFAGGMLLATESLHFVQSRTAMLDVFVAFWIVLGFVFLLLDRRWIATRDARDPSRDGSIDPPPEIAVDPSAPAGVPDTGAHAGHDASAEPVSWWVATPLWRPWRFAAGVALGAGVATKWSALTAVGGAIVLALAWEVTRRRRAGIARPILDALAAEGFGLVLALLVVPSGAYLLSYAGWFAHFGLDLSGWARLQSAIAGYHEQLRRIDPATGEPVHPYLSNAWQWLILRRPVLYYADYGEGVRQTIYANGNPAIFWGSLLAIPYTGFSWWRYRDWRAGAIVVTIAALYVPWFFIPRPQFLFYATPISPFLVLAVVYALRRLSEIRYRGLRENASAPREVRPYAPLAVAFVVVSVALFAWFWPVLTGGSVTDSEWLRRAWFPTWS